MRTESMTHFFILFHEVRLGIIPIRQNQTTFKNAYSEN